MNKKLLTILLAGTFFTTTLLPGISMAKGKMGSGGQGAGIHNGTGSTLQTQTRQKLKDGTGANCDTSGTNTGLKKGNAYGPGDGTDTPLAPKDGTGYGAPANR